jgi:hypothetical protein
MSEMLECVEKRLLAEVHRVVIGERHAVHTQRREHLRRDGRCTEEERLAGSGPRFAPLGDTALEVQHEQVGRQHGLHHFVGEQRAGP